MFFTHVKTSLTDLLNPNHSPFQIMQKKALVLSDTLLLPIGNSHPMSHALDIHNPHKSKTRTEKYNNCKIFEGLLFPSSKCLFNCLFVCFFSLNVVEVRTIQTAFTRNGQQMNWGIIQCHNLAVLKVKLTVT